MSCRRLSYLALLGVVSIVTLACPSGRGPSDELAAGFARPPDSAQPWV